MTLAPGLDEAIDALMDRLYKDGGEEPPRTAMEYDEVRESLVAIASAGFRRGIDVGRFTNSEGEAG